MRSFQQLSVLFALVMFVQTLSAQQQQNMDRNHNEQVTIIGSFDPTINQAYKINVKPEQKPLVFTAPEFTFRSLDTKVETDIQASQVKPLSMKGSKRIKTYNNYLRAGFGSQLTPLLDFYHSSGKSGSHRFNVGIHHFSSFSDIADYSPSPYSNTKLALDFEKYLKYHSFNVGIEYGLNSNRYYGYKPDDFPGLTIPEDDLKQSFNLVAAHLGFKSKYKNRDKLHHAFNLSGYYYFDKHDVSETNASFTFDFHKGFDLTKLLDYQNIGLEGELTYYGNKDSISSSTDFLITGTPYFAAKYGIVAFKVALRFTYLSADESTFHFYPIVDLGLTVIPDALVIYAGVDGNIQKNSYRNLTTENPYLTAYGFPDTNFRWQNSKIIVFGGFRGNIAKKLGYNLEVRWSKFEDMAFFINKSEYSVQPNPVIPIWFRANNKFTIIHDNGSLFTVKGELSLAANASLNVWLGGEYNAYSLDNMNQPYHKPLSSVKLGASYLFVKKLKVWTEPFYYGKRYAIIQNGLTTDVELDGFIDLNLGADYAVSEKFSVFLTATNLLNNNYEVYYSFPVQGINVMAGVALKF